MREEQILARLEVLMERRRQIEAERGPWQMAGADDELDAIILECINLKGKLGARLTSRGRKGGKK